MNNKDNSKIQNSSEIFDDFDQIDIKEIVKILWNKKVTIFLLTSFITLIGIIYIFITPNVYTSYTVLSPASSLKNYSNISSNLSNVASLAGISIPSGSGDDKVSKAIEIMNSLNFFQNFLLKNDYYIEILASKGWDSKTDELIIDKKFYDTNTKKWVSNIKFAVNGRPSLQYAHKEFLKNLSISTDRKTKFITVSYSHNSPNFAKKMLDSLLIEINQIVKDDELKNAELSIMYLKEELSKTQVTDIRQNLNQLVQANYETIMIANSSPEYVFKTLSPAYSPEKKSSPARFFFVIVTSIISIIVSIIYILIDYFYINQRKKI